MKQKSQKKRRNLSKYEKEKLNQCPRDYYRRRELKGISIG